VRSYKRNCSVYRCKRLAHLPELDEKNHDSRSVSAFVRDALASFSLTSFGAAFFLLDPA
jgi:hypothetical protein